jgi:hypothetical protein
MSRTQVYDTIGATYTVTRRTEPRIAAQVWAALGEAQTVLNVGAGTGSYGPPIATSPRWSRPLSRVLSVPLAPRSAWLPPRRVARQSRAPCYARRYLVEFARHQGYRREDVIEMIATRP